jgi:hypothetical protein
MVLPSMPPRTAPAGRPAGPPARAWRGVAEVNRRAGRIVPSRFVRQSPTPHTYPSHKAAASATRNLPSYRWTGS